MMYSSLSILTRSGGRIDHAHHANNAFRAFNETAMFSDTVAMATEITDRSDTLIVVTADHGHSMFMGSYTRNDADILGGLSRTVWTESGETVNEIPASSCPGERLNQLER